MAATAVLLLLLAVGAAHGSSLRHAATLANDVDVAAGSSCDNAGIAYCNEQFMKCYEMSGDRCDCRGSVYVTCLKNLGCPANMIASVIEGCIEAGCPKDKVLARSHAIKVSLQE